MAVLHALRRQFIHPTRVPQHTTEFWTPPAGEKSKFSQKRKYAKKMYEP